MIRHHEMTSRELGHITARVSLPCEPWNEDDAADRVAEKARAAKARKDRERRLMVAERREKIRKLAEMGANRARIKRLIEGLSKTQLDNDLKALGIKLPDSREHPDLKNRVLAVIRDAGQIDANGIAKELGVDPVTAHSRAKQLIEDGLVRLKVQRKGHYRKLYCYKGGVK